MPNATRKSLCCRLPVLGRVAGGINQRMVLWGIGTCLFFVLYFLHVRHHLNPQLLYHADELALPSGKVIDFPIYRQGTAFGKEFLGRPGGLSEYIAARFCQYYYYSCLGPLVLTTVALGLYLLSHWLIGIGGGRGSRGLRFVPPLLLLIACNQYTFGLHNHVALVAALIAAAFYFFVAARTDRAAVKLVVFAIASVALYYTAGGSYMLLALLCALFEFLTGRRYLLGGLYVLAAALVPLVGVWFFEIAFDDAYFRPSGLFPFDGTVGVMSLWGLYVFFVLVAIALPFRRALGRLGSALGMSRLTGKIKVVCGVVVLATASVSAALLTVDRDARRVLQANYLARMERWGELLEEVQRHRARDYPPSVMLDINRALFETGQMGSRMFSYPQHPSVLLEIGSHAVSYKGGCEVLLRLGRINEAEHATLEALEINGARPETLRRLAIIYIVKDQPEAARVFLTRLSEDLVAGQWARDTLRRLEDDPRLSSDEQIKYLRSVMPLHDMIVTSTGSADVSTGPVNMKEVLLLALLVRNRKNRMAFEYLMAYYLLTKQPGKIACSIGRLDDFDYPAVPDHYGEAVLMYGYNVRRQVNLAGPVIRAYTREKVRKVIGMAGNCKGDKDAISKALTGSFPNSYCRYLLTDNSGGAR